MYFWDYTIILLIPAMILSIYAQQKVNSTFRQFSRVASKKGYTGAQIANHLLMIAGITDVKIEPVAGNLTDHYDPRNKTLRLSQSVYNSSSIAATGVAAHETGHAIQHNIGYAPLNFRTAIFPIVSIGSKLSGPLIMIGLLFGFLQSSLFILNLGILLFSFCVLFQLITLPVEFNASSRAIKLLESNQFLAEDEVPYARKVLSAAALTYVAAAAVSIANLFRFLLIAKNRRR